jgi:hypothetical protein
MTLTDKILIFAALILFWRGWNKGILRTIFGPIALVVCSILSYLYYLWTHDLVMAAAIGIVAPIVLNIIFSIMLNLLASGKEKNSISIFSRTIAALLNLLWGEFIIVTILITVLMLPFELPSLNKYKTDIKTSLIYSFFKPTMDGIFKTNHIQPLDPGKVASLSDPKKLEILQRTPEFQGLVNDPRIQDLLNDPTIGEQIQNKQIAELMKNPKFLELTRDPELLKKFMALYSKMLQ